MTVVEVLPQILPVEDHEIQTFARKSFEKQGIKILTNAKVTKLDKKADSVTATIEAGGKSQTDHRRARHLRRRRRRQYRKPRPGKARRQDRARPHRRRSAQQDQCARHLRHRRRLRPADAGAQGRARGRDLRRGDQGPQPASDDKLMIPGCTYCTPQVASVGLTEQAAKDKKPRHPRRPLSLRRQRQGDRAGRGSGPGQSDLRQEDRASCSARTWSAPKSPN